MLITRAGVMSDLYPEFYRLNWPRRTVLAEPVFYRWQFLRAPSCTGVDHSCVALGDRGEILAIMGLTPRAFNMRGTLYSSAEPTSWCVAPTARRRGIGTAMLEWLQHSYAIQLGAGISAQARGLYADHGFTYIRAIPRYVQVYRALPFSIQAGPLRRDFAKAPVQRINAFPLSCGDVADRVEKWLSNFNYYTRDVAYLHWRYWSHPVFTYHFFQIDDSVVGLRVDNANDISIVHIVECFGTAQSLPKAVSFIDQFCIETGIYLADFTCTASTIGAYFRAAQWLSAVDDMPQVAHLFHPPELRNPPTTSLILWAADTAIRPDLLDVGRLYLTKGDLDLDRPVVEFYSRTQADV